MGKASGVMEASDDKEYGGSLISLLQNGEEFIKNNTKKSWKKTADGRVELPVLRENSDATTAEMASALQMSPAGIRKNLYALCDGGYIERVGSDKSDRWKVLR